PLPHAVVRAEQDGAERVATGPQHQGADDDDDRLRPPRETPEPVTHKCDGAPHAQFSHSRSMRRYLTDSAKNTSPSCRSRFRRWSYSSATSFASWWPGSKQRSLYSQRATVSRVMIRGRLPRSSSPTFPVTKALGRRVVRNRFGAPVTVSRTRNQSCAGHVTYALSR